MEKNSRDDQKHLVVLLWAPLQWRMQLRSPPLSPILTFGELCCHNLGSADYYGPCTLSCSSSRGQITQIGLPSPPTRWRKPLAGASARVLSPTMPFCECHPAPRAGEINIPRAHPRSIAGRPGSDSSPGRVVCSVPARRSTRRACFGRVVCLLLCFFFIIFFFLAVSWQQEWRRRRIPMGVLSPDFLFYFIFS